MNKKIEELYNKIDGLNSIIDLQTLEISKLKNRIDRALSYIGLLYNNLKDYTEYEEYTNIFNEMLKDIEEILGDKE